MTIGDHFSKFFGCYLVTSKTAQETEKNLRKFFRAYGKPLKLQSDNGSELKNERIQRFLDKEGVDYRYGAPFYPHLRGFVEVSNLLIKKDLRAAYQQFHDKSKFDVDLEIQQALDIYNNTKHQTTKNIPSEAIRLDNRKLEDKQRIEEIIEHTRESQKRKIESISFKVGDFVIIKDPINKQRNMIATQSKQKRSNFCQFHALLKDLNLIYPRLGLKFSETLQFLMQK